MEIPVLIETVQNNGFRARTGEPLPLSAAEYTGFFREDDPIVLEWLQIMKENREKDENDSNYL
jgi:hypothetical protein